jgi:hypothetical protein
MRRRFAASAIWSRSATAMLEDRRRGAPAWMEIMVMSFVLVGARSDAGDEVLVEWVVQQVPGLGRAEAGFSPAGFTATSCPRQAAVEGSIAAVTQPTWR